ncbi:MAG TPA: 3-phosphoserine/phosphohydroxythreonine transaminase [Propionibacteriaceae bacterium]|nr:3-phosphoserine/phosphohydroxythreonine transaminase [Propionibacteriaceae bacterium]
MPRVFNFSAGPAALPEDVLRQAADEMLDWHGSGQSVMEMSHRGKEFTSIAEAAEADLRELLAVPDGYQVLFLQGGASLQFEMIPMNLMRGKRVADYVHTGEWAKKAIKAAQGLGAVNIAASAEDRSFTYVPAQQDWRLSDGAAYLHYTSNETIGGVEFHWIPDIGDVPLVSDMSSDLLSRPVDVARYGLIYAGAQKNIGPAGLTIVIVRDDLVGAADPAPSAMLNYATHAGAGSMYNTPPTYAIYVAGLVFRRLLESGGLAAAERRNVAKASLLYDYLDSTDFYRNPVAVADRSRMNVPFTLADASLDAHFLSGASKRGLLQLKGHRSVGGMRASIYNAMTLDGVQALVDYMTAFAATKGDPA